MVVQLPRSFSRSFDMRKFSWFDQPQKPRHGSHAEAWAVSPINDRSVSVLPTILSPQLSLAMQFLASPAPRTIPRAPEHRRKSAHPCRAAESVATETSTDMSSSPHVSSPTVPNAAQSQYRARSPPEKLYVRHLSTAGGIGKVRAKKASSKSSADSHCTSKVCFACGVSKTPMWRRVDDEIYCNACGLKRKRAACGR